MRTVVEQLEDYTEIDCGDELAEAVQALCFLSRREDCLGDDFKAALKQELDKQLKNYQENCEVVEREETVVVKRIELVWHE